MVVGITPRPQTCRTRALVLLDPVKERLLTLGWGLLDGELALGVLGVQPAQFYNKFCGHTTIRVLELIVTKEWSASTTIVHKRVISYPLLALVKGEFCCSSMIVAIDSMEESLEVEHWLHGRALNEDRPRSMNGSGAFWFC